MNEKQMRAEALANALQVSRNRGGTGTAHEIVDDAKVFYQFLKSNESKK